MVGFGGSDLALDCRRQSVTKLLVARVRQEEEEKGKAGMAERELVAWYMDHIKSNSNYETIQQVTFSRTLLEPLKTQSRPPNC